MKGPSVEEQPNKKGILQRIFGLPPVEKRKMSQGLLRQLFLPPRFTLRSDDTYIYYLCSRASLIFTSVLLFLNWVSLVWQVDFNLYLFSINMPENNFIEAFAHSFPFYTATLLLCTVIPFYLVKFRWNINPKTVDILWWTLLESKKKRNRILMILYFFVISGISLFVMYGTYGAPLFIMLYAEQLHDSFGFLLFIFCLYAILFSLIPYILLVSIVGLYRYVGSYSGDLSSKSIQGGKQ